MHKQQIILSPYKIHFELFKYNKTRRLSVFLSPALFMSSLSLSHKLSFSKNNSSSYNATDHTSPRTHKPMLCQAHRLVSEETQSHLTVMDVTMKQTHRATGKRARPPP